MPFMASTGFAGVGAIRGSLITMRETPVVISMAQTTPKVESEASKVVGLSVMRPLRKTAFLTAAAMLIAGGPRVRGKWTRYMRFEPGGGGIVL